MDMTLNRRSILVTQRFQCSYCESTFTSKQELDPGHHFTAYWLPGGWVDILGNLVCPKHEISVDEEVRRPANKSRTANVDAKGGRVSAEEWAEFRRLADELQGHVDIV